MPNHTAVIIPFGAPVEAHGLHVARQLEGELRHVGLGGSDAAVDLRTVVRRRLGNPPLWDAIVAGTDLLTTWAFTQAVDTPIDAAEDAIDRAAGWLRTTMPPEINPFDDDILGVLYNGTWTTYSLHSGRRIEDHPTAPLWVHQLPIVE